MRWLAPTCPASKILESATLIGARALGLGDELGTTDAGQAGGDDCGRACRRQVDDVEEFLSAASSRRQLQWLSLDLTIEPNPEPCEPLATYLSFIRFSHSVFALPFALTGALLACARSRRSRGGRSAGSSSRWWRRAVPRWDSIAWSMPAWTR